MKSIVSILLLSSHLLSMKETPKKLNPPRRDTLYIESPHWETIIFSDKNGNTVEMEVNYSEGASRYKR